MNFKKEERRMMKERGEKTENKSNTRDDNQQSRMNAEEEGHKD